MTKERLRNYCALKAEHKSLKQRIADTEARLYALRVPVPSDMPKAPTPGPSYTTEALIDTLDRLRGLYAAKEAEIAAELLDIEQAIGRLENPTHRDLLRYKYLDGMTWEEVCVAIRYSWSQVHRLHSAALQELKQKGEKNEM